MNLIVNARDAMSDGGHLKLLTQVLKMEAAKVSINPEVIPGDYVVLSVSDTGSGMSAEVRARLFEPFLPPNQKVQARGWGWQCVTVSLIRRVVPLRYAVKWAGVQHLIFIYRLALANCQRPT